MGSRLKGGGCTSTAKRWQRSRTRNAALTARCKQQLRHLLAALTTLLELQKPRRLRLSASVRRSTHPSSSLRAKTHERPSISAALKLCTTTSAAATTSFRGILKPL